MSDLHDRLRRVRSRLAIRAWEYRQREHARGVWFKLRRALADASAAYTISDDDAARLVSEGAAPLAVGHALAPPRTLLVLPLSRVHGVPSARPIPVRLGADLLTARAVILVPFDEGSG
jgi:hypothetical protein